MRALSLIILFATEVSHGAPGTWADRVAPIAVYKPDEASFIDDAFALRGDGRSIAYLTTDGATQASLHLANVPADQTEVLVAHAPTHAAAIHWLGNDRVLVVDRDPASGRLSAQSFSPKGPSREKLGPVDAVAPSSLDGKPVIVTYSRSEKKGVEHTFVAYSLDALKPIARRVYNEDADGRIAERGGPLKVLWWQDGYSAAAALKAGEFDKARDMRRPDRFVRLEVFKGKVSEDHEIDDLLAFATASLEHKKHDGEKAFVHLSDDHKKLLVTDGLLERELKLARELSMYDANSFRHQLLDDGRLILSATVDPTNPAAVARRKADPDDLEIYVVAPKGRATTEALRLAGQSRPTGWQVGGGRIAVLRKSKGFDRGGIELEVHALDGAATASTH